MGVLNQIIINTEIQRVKSTRTAKKLFDSHGLCLAIRSTGGASWQYNYRVDGKPKTLSIGTYPIITLKQARIAHQKAMLMRYEGRDPAQEKQKSRLNIKIAKERTFKHYCDKWHAMQTKRWSDEYAANVKHDLERLVLPSLGHVPIDEINPLQVSNLLTDMSERGLGDTTQRAYRRISNILNYAVQTGHLTINPVLSLSGFVQAPPVKHQLALPEKELVEFFKRLSTQGAREHTKIALLILIITFVRNGSLRSVTWEDRV